MNLTLGFSSCPNDTFIFDAMVNGKIDTEGIVFDVVMEDVEALNRKAVSSDLDITKLSYHAYGYVWEDYILLESGSALGENCGPLLISKTKIQNPPLEVPKMNIAIPGEFTTANLLFSLAFPDATMKKEMLFSEIEDAVIKGEADAGLLIHENRFTYHTRGLEKIMDLGVFWEKLCNAPLPLGGIAIKRSVPDKMKQKINRIISKSVRFALNHPNSSFHYVKCNAQTMDDDVMKKHIELYVNDYTVNLGKKGVLAIRKLFEKAIALNLLEPTNKTLILNH